MGSLAAENTTATAEAQLFERHSDLVYRYCLRMLSSREEAEDATQTTFVHALRALRRGVTPNFEQAWLLTIARNECKSRYRAGSRRRARELAHDPQTLAEFAAAAPNGGDGRLIGVQSALSRLPETQRRALLLREWQGRSYAEIARELGVSRPAVEALLFRARRSLARELGEGTTERRHALDLASLLAAAKSLLGGGAAVKVAAAGVAAVATVGVVSGGAQRGPAPMIPVRDAPAKTRPVADVRRGAEVQTSQPAVIGKNEARPASTKREPVVRKAKPGRTAPAPAVVAEAPRSPSPSAPAPRPGAAQPAAPTPAGTPYLPEVPSVPPAPVPPPPAPPALPVVGELPLPPLPPLPQLPQVETPVPLPEVQLPEVPDLPIVGDLPILP